MIRKTAPSLHLLVVTPPRRVTSRVMSAIHSKGNATTELAFASLLRAAKISGWRRHSKVLGTPDFAFPRQKVAVFLDGCFWHGCSIHGRKPKTNSVFWETKIQRTRARDNRISRNLRKCGWIVIRIWEHEIKSKPANCISKVQTKLQSRSTAKQGSSG
jgi:DNA mismatch endonuclease (patch repair protein)